ncbi:MAG: flagellar hook-basal body complex protein FliE [Oligoflexia bacterium]|nr:flagellar hook-basal body complex protein FliE [Oligoflexia bacterium]
MDIEIPRFGVNESSPDNKSFTEMLSDSVKKVEDLQREADKAMINLATGKTEDIHETMIAVNKAEIAFQLMTQIRNKAIEAYKEIMKMQV